MFFGKKDKLIGLDIGSRSIKVAELAETKKGPSLKKFGLIDLTPGAIEEGLVRDPKAVADSIRELFKLYNISEQNVAISIGGYSVIVKKIFVPAMAEEKLQETIHVEAEQYIPFDISDVNLDFQILGESEHNTSQMAVMLVAAKKEMINDYVQLVQMAGLNPCTIDIDAFALQNIFEINHRDDGDNVALIDIGASKTSLNILKAKTSVFMRDVSLGCSQINQKITSLLGCSFEEAEQIKLSDQPEGISPEGLRDITSTIVTDWCTEIRRALDFFYSTYPDDQVKRIVLSGGGANIAEFRDLLAVETSADVVAINPFAGYYVDDEKFDPAYLEKIGPQAAICMGLANRRVNDK
jgi:type IV pilus assembly protein PilM